MNNLQLGFIGRNAIEDAILELENRTYISNIWIETPHTGNYIKGQDYNNIEELLSENQSIDCFSDLQGYYDFVEDIEMEVDNTILELLKNGTVYCDFGNERFSNDKDEIIKFIIEDGSTDSYYTYDEAMKNLKSNNVDEALVIWLIS